MNPAIALANLTLEREAWARDKLSAHAGRTLRISIGPAATRLTIRSDGTLTSAQATPDLTLNISPLHLPTLLAQPERWSDLVVADGDADLAATLAQLAQTLPWFVEQALARILGPIAGTRVADIGRQMLRLPDYVARRVGAGVGSYVRDETGIALKSADAADFAAEIDALRARVDALAARIEALSQAARAPKNRG